MVEQELNNAYSKVKDWCSIKSWKLNAENTECVMFWTEESAINHPDEISLDGTQVNISNCYVDSSWKRNWILLYIDIIICILYKIWPLQRIKQCIYMCIKSYNALRKHYRTMNNRNVFIRNSYSFIINCETYNTREDLDYC